MAKKAQKTATFISIFKPSNKEFKRGAQQAAMVLNKNLRAIGSVTDQLQEQIGLCVEKVQQELLAVRNGGTINWVEVLNAEAKIEELTRKLKIAKKYKDNFFEGAEQKFDIEVDTNPLAMFDVEEETQEEEA